MLKGVQSPSAERTVVDLVLAVGCRHRGGRAWCRAGDERREGLDSGVSRYLAGRQATASRREGRVARRCLQRRRWRKKTIRRDGPRWCGHGPCLPPAGREGKGEHRVYT